MFKDAASARDVQQDATPDDAVLERLDRVGRRAGRRHSFRRNAVVHQAFVGDVAEGVDVTVSVVVIIGAHEVLRELQRARRGVDTGVHRHAVNRRLGIVGGGLGVEPQAQRDADAFADTRGGCGHELRPQMIHRAALVSVAPATP